MRWLDVVLGRTKPVKSRTEKLFAMSTAQVTLEVKLEAKSTGEGGITFKPVTAASFDSAASELKDLLDLTTKETGSHPRCAGRLRLQRSVRRNW